MRRFVEEADRGQWTLLPECLDDFIDESNPVRVIDVFVEALDLAEMSFEGVEPAATGRPSYHPSVLLKLYIYGYLNRIQSSRRLEREAGRNVEVMWLLGRLAPDHKTIADFRKDNGLALRKVCARFVELCREMGLLATASVAIVAVYGTKAKCQPHQTTSEFGGEAENIGSFRVFRILTQLYGPAVRCKPNVKKWRGLVLRICIRPLHGAVVLLAIMDIRAHPISFSERP